MPELPEVATIRKELCTQILNRKILCIRYRRRNLRYPLPSALPRLLRNKQFKQIRQHGKYLIFTTNSDYCVIWHLGMSGSFRIYSQLSTVHLPQKHEHIIVDLAGKRSFVYYDPRRFGFIILCHYDKINENRHLKHLGPDALSKKFTGAYLFQKISKRKLAVKNLLLDQTVIAGLGNIYVCEALWLSAISPLRSSNSLQRAQCYNLVTNIKKILRRALAQGGSTLRDYRKTDGEMGYFQNEWMCYEQAQKRCLRKGCSGRIECIKQNGRSSYYCPRHQK